MRKLLLTNDDGIDAEGLQALRAVAATLGETVLIAPTQCHSGGSHRVTTEAPIQVVRHTTDRIALVGTPADCVRIGLEHLYPSAAWVLAGINHGGNLGVDLYYSGTVAAVREGVLHGRPGIAVSHYRRKNSTPCWQRAARWLLPVLRELMEQPLPAGAFWNVNLPDPEPGAPEPSVMHCPIEAAALPLCYLQDGDRYHYKTNYHERPREPGSDVDVCFRGHIAVSLVRLVG